MQNGRCSFPTVNYSRDVLILNLRDVVVTSQHRCGFLIMAGAETSVVVL